MNAVNVVYQSQIDGSARSYTYKVSPELTLAVGDMVVVPIGDMGIFKVATVVKIVAEFKPANNITYKWIVQKIDFTVYNQYYKL